MIDQSDPGVEPKARARKKAAMPATEPTPPEHPIRTGLQPPRGNTTLWAMFAAACVVALVLLGMLANRPRPLSADTQVASAPDSATQSVTYGTGGGSYVNGPMPDANAGGGTYAPGASAPGAAGVTGTAGTASVGNAGATAMTGTTGGVNTGAPGAMTAPGAITGAPVGSGAAGSGAGATANGSAFGPGARGAGSTGGAGTGAAGTTGNGPGAGSAGSTGAAGAGGSAGGGPG